MAPVARVAWKEYGEVTVADDEETIIAYSTTSRRSIFRSTPATSRRCEEAVQFGLDLHREAGQRRMFRQVLWYESYPSDHDCGPLHLRPLGRLLCEDRPHQWLDKRSVAAVAPAAIRQRANSLKAIDALLRCVCP